MQSIIIDQKYPECCALSLESHLENTLGLPIKLPPSLAEKLTDNWANECEDDLLALFELITGSEYQQVHRDNSYNQANDLDSFMVWTVYADTSAPDWVWRRDAFVVVEVGSGGDPRYCGYSPARIYRLDDNTIGDSGFLDWTLGWWAEPISTERYDEEQLDNFNDRISACYSSEPYYQLENLLYSAPVWCEKLQAFLGRFKDCTFPVRLYPIEPAY